MKRILAVVLLGLLAADLLAADAYSHLYGDDRRARSYYSGGRRSVAKMPAGVGRIDSDVKTNAVEKAEPTTVENPILLEKPVEQTETKSDEKPFQDEKPVEQTEQAAVKQTEKPSPGPSAEADSPTEKKKKTVDSLIDSLIREAQTDVSGNESPTSGGKTADQLIESLLRESQPHDQAEERPAKTEKVVEKPVTVEKVVEKPVVIEKQVVVERTNVVEKVVDRIVERPVPVEKIVERPVTVEKVVEKPVVVEKKVIVERTNVVEKVVDRIVEQPVVVEKKVVVEKPVEVERIVVVERTNVVEKVVRDTAREMELMARERQLLDQLAKERDRRQRLERVIPKADRQFADKTLKINARSAFYDRKEGYVVFEGDVHVRDEEYVLCANKAFVFTDQTNSVKYVVAIDNVAVTNGAKRAYGTKASYYRKTGMVVLHGDAKTPAIVRDESRVDDQEVIGEKIKFWVNSEQVEVLKARISSPIQGQGDLSQGLLGK